MKKSVAKQWVAALRSGQYTQGRHALKSPDRKQPAHCCLGVLCELYVQDNPDEDGWEREPGRLLPTLEGESSILPAVVRKWSGMQSEDGQFYDGDVEHTLVELNDGEVKGKDGGLFKDDIAVQPLNFNTLAQLIEQKWEHL